MPAHHARFELGRVSSTDEILPDETLWVYDEEFVTNHGELSRYQQRRVGAVSIAALADVLRKNRSTKTFAARKRPVIELLDGVTARRHSTASSPDGHSHREAAHDEHTRLEVLHACERIGGEIAVYSCALSTTSADGGTAELIFGVEDVDTRKRWLALL